jgi:putative hydrolase of the HAD superfamily
MSPITAVVSDFGGVLTSPLREAFTAFEERSGISVKDLGAAMAAITERTGANPLIELETGRMTEAAFLGALGEELTSHLGRPISLEGFGEDYFRHMQPNVAMIELMRDLRHRGYRMAICTNNVREWEPRWRSMLPVDEIFELVVDSGFVGVRKPDPAIYAIVLEQLGVAASETLFVDDIDVNCAAARELGMTAVQFHDTEQAIAEIAAALA